MELVADFTLNNEALNAQFDVSEVTNFDALFKIYANPEKVSQLENDLNFQTGEQVAETVQNASAVINARIDEEVGALNTEIAKKVETVNGSSLIGVFRNGSTVTITSNTFVFEQGIPSDTWIINHNLNKHPSVELVYYNGQGFEAYREYPSNNQVIIKLDNAATGYAYLN